MSQVSDSKGDTDRLVSTVSNKVKEWFAANVRHDDDDDDSSSYESVGSHYEKVEKKRPPDWWRGANDVYFSVPEVLDYVKKITSPLGENYKDGGVMKTYQCMACSKYPLQCWSPIVPAMTKVKSLGSSRKPSTSAGFNDMTAMLGHINAKARNDPIHFALYQYFQIKYKEPAMPTTTFNPVAQRKPRRCSTLSLNGIKHLQRRRYYPLVG